MKNGVLDQFVFFTAYIPIYKYKTDFFDSNKDAKRFHDLADRCILDKMEEELVQKIQCGVDPEKALEEVNTFSCKFMRSKKVEDEQRKWRRDIAELQSG